MDAAIPPLPPSVPGAADIGRSVGLALIGIALAYGTVVLLLFPRWTVDDAFITFRYAENLARHGSLTWNVGSDPVEGYTGIALPLLIATGLRLGIDPIVASHALGLLSLAVAALALDRIARALGAALFARGLALLALLAHPSLPAHVYSGLETMFFAAALLVTQWTLWRALEAPRGAAPRSETLLLLAALSTCLVRPEGFLMAALVTAALTVGRACERPTAVSGWIGRMAGILVLPLALYVTWRWTFYGRPLPNTYYAKQAASFPDPAALADLLLFSRRYLAGPALAFLLLAVVVAMASRRGRGRPRSSPFARSFPLFITVVGGFAGVTALTYLGSNLAMNYSHRFWMPLFVSLLPLAAVAVDRGLRALSALRVHRPVAALVVAVLLALIGLGQLAVMARELPHEVRTARSYQQLLGQSHLRIGRLLAAVSPALGTDPPLLVTVRDAGAIPYLSRLPTVDFGLLNDEYLGAAPRSERERADYFFASRPEFVTMTGFGGRGPIAPYLTEDPRFSDFVPWLRYGNDSPLYHTQYQVIYVRRDILAAVDGERRALEASGALRDLEPAVPGPTTAIEPGGGRWAGRGGPAPPPSGSCSPVQ